MSTLSPSQADSPTASPMTSPAATPAKHESELLMSDDDEPDDSTIDSTHRRFELTQDVLVGLRTAVGKVEGRPLKDLTLSDFQEMIRIPFPKKGSKSTPAHSGRSFYFKDYAPEVFRRIRLRFQVDPSAYILSVCGNAQYLEFIPSSRSGEFFFFSHDQKYMIKTISKAEARLLVKILPDYYEHFQNNQDSLITRYCGLHKVQPHNQKLPTYFLVMASIFPSKMCLFKFDLKGSTVNRYEVTPQEEEARSDKVYKDLNLLELGVKLNLSYEQKIKWVDTLKKDVTLLEKWGIMDFSLLIGIYDPSLTTIPYMGPRKEEKKEEFNLDSSSNKTLIKSPKNLNQGKLIEEQPAETKKACKALFAAIKKNDKEQVKKCLAEGASPDVHNKAGFTPIMLGSEQVLPSLIAAKADLDLQDPTGQTALMLAASKNQMGKIKLLVAAKAALDVTTGNHTALMIAAQQELKEIVAYLIENNSNMNDCNSMGQTALMQAVVSKKPRKEIVDLLAKANADLDLPDRQGASPLVRAAQLKRTSLCKQLLEAKANTDSQADRGDGFSALHWFASHGSLPDVEMLVAAKADVMLTEKYGWTPREIAEQKGNKSVVAVLKKAEQERLAMPPPQKTTFCALPCPVCNRTFDSLNPDKFCRLCYRSVCVSCCREVLEEDLVTNVHDCNLCEPGKATDRIRAVSRSESFRTPKSAKDATRSLSAGRRPRRQSASLQFPNTDAKELSKVASNHAKETTILKSGASRWTQDKGGIRGQGGETYFMGIIDILIVYTLRKKLETSYKVTLLRNNGNEISAVSPELYARRFIKFMENFCDYDLIAHPNKPKPVVKTSRYNLARAPNTISRSSSVASEIRTMLSGDSRATLDDSHRLDRRLADISDDLDDRSDEEGAMELA